MSVVSGLDGILEPLSRCLDAESARRLVDFQVDTPTQARLDVLAELANEGTISSDERAEYEALINAADLIAVLKSKARRQFSPSVSIAMDAGTRDFVRERAGLTCEDCRLHQFQSPANFHIEHIVAKQHGGQDDLPNLALSCHRCNFHIRS